MNNNKEWFADWFNSPYYHILYQNRNEAEAEVFIKNLIEQVSLKKNASVVDLACGKGRHSFELSKYGLQVKGLDLSPNSIASANENYIAKNLSFGVHDMRLPFGNQEFEAVFNLFTSIGYFDDKNDNRKVMEAIYASVKEEGILVIDFMNAQKVVKNLVAKETKTLNNIDFYIERKVVDGYIIKTIDFEDKGKKYHFEEKVEALFFKDFECMLYGLFDILAVYGDYDLNGFDAEDSNRLILYVKRI